MSAEKAPDSNLSAWLTIGAFDGVHRGHQAVIHDLVAGAHGDKVNAVVITFFPHPAEVLGGIEAPYYLTTLDEREILFKELGVDEVVTFTFNENFAKKTARDFIAELHQQHTFHHMLIGHDFRFGAGRQGDINLLIELGKQYGFNVQSVPPFRIDGQIVSSSFIRQAILNRQMDMAARFLGRWYLVSGAVVHGDGRGHLMGIPTANVAAWQKQLLPPNGVYAARVEVDGTRLAAVLSIGNRPTFYFPPINTTLEVHILDFHQDIYGKVLQVEFIEFLRKELKFESADELMGQIQKDIQKTREVLANAPQTPDLST
jgi:riboflavin kinase / FMN adenylyltransferase